MMSIGSCKVNILILLYLQVLVTWTLPALPQVPPWLLVVPCHTIHLSNPGRMVFIPQPLRDRRSVAGVAKHHLATGVAVRGAWTKPWPASWTGSSRPRSACSLWRRRGWRESFRLRSAGNSGRRGGQSRSASMSSACSACSRERWLRSDSVPRLLRHSRLTLPSHRQLICQLHWWPQPQPPSPHLYLSPPQKLPQHRPSPLRRQ